MARRAARAAHAPEPRPDPLARYRAALDEARARFAVLPMRPLHVRARLFRAVATIDPILFDGVLRRGMGARLLNAPELAGTNEGSLLDVPLPLASTDGARAFPLASVAFATPRPDPEGCVRAGNPHLLEYAATWHKTWEHSGDDFLAFVGRGDQPLRGKITIASGEFKGWAMPLTIVGVRELHWWAVGHAETVAAALAHVAAVGKRAAWGQGAVRDWLVESAAEDWSRTGPGGTPSRPLPVEDYAEMPGAVRSVCAYRSPGYDRRGWIECWVPG